MRLITSSFKGPQGGRGRGRRHTLILLIAGLSFVSGASRASEQHELLDKSLAAVASGSLPMEATLHTICSLESSKQIRKYQPHVLQNMDYMGAHNVVLFEELRHEGLITDAKKWQDSQEWLVWRRFFQNRPDIGTLFAARKFRRIALKYGIDNALQIWNSGKIGSVKGLEYLMAARCVRRQYLKTLRRR